MDAARTLAAGAVGTALVFEEPATGARLRLAIDGPVAARDFFREREETDLRLLTIAWNRGADQTVWVDDVPVAVPAGCFVTLMVNATFRFERASALVLWQFNRALYCIVDHDREVSCVGLLFYGAHGTMVVRPAAADVRRFEALLDVFVDEMQTRDATQGEMLRMLLKRLIIKLTRLARAQHVPDGLDAAHLDVIRRFNLLVEQHYRRLHRVADYAALLHRSPKTLANLSARAGQGSPLQTIRGRLALEARRLLRYTDRSVKQVAHDLGFESPATFSRFFRQETGASPAAFRAAVPREATPD